MNFNEKIRNFSFWFSDFITGGVIKKHYVDIKHLIENQGERESIDKQEKYLNALLKHSVETTEFYKGVDFSNLLNFPVIDKKAIKSSYAKIQSKEYKNKKKTTVTTSGSTGASFAIYHDINKTNRSKADIIYFSELNGFFIGYKLFYLRFWSMFKKKNKFISFIQNIVSIDVFDLSPGLINKLLKSIRNSSSHIGMLGYASSFDKICNYLDSINSDPIHCNLVSVIGISERLDPNTKLSMKKYFNVDMISRYSNTENGMLAQQPAGEEYFVINSASYFIEILNINDDDRVEEDELGRIVVTDLFNYGMPIIRYDTGDMGIMGRVTANEKSKFILTKIEGRKSDMIYNTSGKMLSTSILLVVNNFKEIKQRQIIQKTKKKYLFKLKVENNIFEKEKELISEFKKYLGADAVIELEYVDEIPLLKSGKEQAIINELKI